MTQATQQGASTDIVTGPISEDEAGELLLKRFLPSGEDEDAPEKKPSSKKKDKAAEQDTSDEDDDEKDPAEKLGDDENVDDEEKDDKDENEDDAEAEVTIKVKHDGKEVEVPASQLARLYGQEASLTKKSMEVAEQRKTYDTKLQEQVATTAAILDRAKARWEPYSKLDFNLLATQVTPEEYTALRQSAQSAWDDVSFLENNAQAFVKQIADQKAADHKTQAKEAIKTLAGPEDKGGIEGWSEKLYDDIRAHAISQGMPEEFVNGTVDPSHIRMMHNAMLYARGRDKAKSKVTVTKVNKTPKKIVKTTTNSKVDRSEGKSGDATKAMSKLRKSGSTDDAAEAFLARWANKDSDD